MWLMYSPSSLMASYQTQAASLWFSLFNRKKFGLDSVHYTGEGSRLPSGIFFWVWVESWGSIATSYHSVLVCRRVCQSVWIPPRLCNSKESLLLCETESGHHLTLQSNKYTVYLRNWDLKGPVGPPARVKETAVNGKTKLYFHKTPDSIYYFIPES